MASINDQLQQISNRPRDAMPMRNAPARVMETSPGMRQTSTPTMAAASPTQAVTPAVAGQAKLREEDLASGRLSQFDNFSNPVFKRAGSLAGRMSASRGLGNSSMAIGNAQGAILDRATDIAISDSNNLSSTCGGR